MGAALDALASGHGVARSYVDARGHRVDVPPETLEAVLGAMGVRQGRAAGGGGRPLLPPVVVLIRGHGTARVPLLGRTRGSLEWRLAVEDGSERAGRTCADKHGLPLVGRRLPLGYHRLQLTGEGRQDEATVIMAPRRCFLPSDRSAMWGVATQLYGIRSARNWGMGDFADLADLATAAAREGAACVGVNPLHALFPPATGMVSPYSPSSRSFLSALYIAPDRVPELADSAPARDHLASAQATLAELRATGLVDYAGVAAAKEPVFKALHRAFTARRRAAPDNPRAAAFAAFVSAGGEALRHFAAFEALVARLSSPGKAADWRAWPAAYRSPDTPTVCAFAAQHGDPVDYRLYLQWLADMQLAEVARTAETAGMALGLYRDLAVGVHPGGAEAWAEGRLTVPGVSIGAPPDAYNTQGQEWGLAPFDPIALRAAAYRPFAAVLAANMRHAGALRIDHVMGLNRLFWVPQGMAPRQGTYVDYPLEDLVRIVALESVRSRCVVIGEDLGTVPAGLRPRLRRAGVLSYRLLYFERGKTGRFKAPRRWPRQCAVAVSTHDLPTVRGFWAGRDIQWRRELGLEAPQAAVAAERGREAARVALVAALRAAGLTADGDYGPSLREAMHAFLARTPSRLMLVQLEDLADELEQANLPGTVEGHPNWRRKLPLPLARLFNDRSVRALLAVVRQQRARSC